MKSARTWLSLPALLSCTQLDIALCVGVLGTGLLLLGQGLLKPLQNWQSERFSQFSLLLIAALGLSVADLLLARFNLPLQQSLAAWLPLLLLPALSLNHASRPVDALLFLLLALSLGLINSALALLLGTTQPWLSMAPALAQPSLNLLLLGVLLVLARLTKKEPQDER